MVKKVSASYKVSIIKQDLKGAAWLVKSVKSITHVPYDDTEYSAWANASAAKRWVKELVKANTPRKSIKMIAGTTLDAKGKPLSFTGELLFKVVPE